MNAEAEFEQRLMDRLRSVYGGRSWLVAGEVGQGIAGVPPLIDVRWGNEPDGGLIFGRFTDAMPVGPAVAPVVVTLRALLSEYWQLDLPDLPVAFDA